MSYYLEWMDYITVSNVIVMINLFLVRKLLALHLGFLILVLELFLATPEITNFMKFGQHFTNFFWRLEHEV